MSKESKNQRTLDIYVRLCEGKVINKKTESQNFGMDERSIQRDIDDSAYNLTFIFHIFYSDAFCRDDFVS